MRLALIGTGRMGTPIAARLRAAGHDLTVYDLAPAARRRMEDEGFTVATGVAEAAGGPNWCC
ncbi:MAG TPA: NAD(P)-binding domain-containing protein [Candidatus Dormibacteraeota bacterium]